MRVTSSASAALSARQDRGRAQREHRLAGSGARRSAAGCGHPQRRSRARAPHGAVRARPRGRAPLRRRARSSGRAAGSGVAAPAAENAHGAARRSDDGDPQALDERRLVCAGGASASRSQAGAACRVGDRERAACGPHRAVQPELAEERIAARGARAGAGRSRRAAAQASARSSPGPGLGHVARREVGRDPPAPGTRSRS